METRCCQDSNSIGSFLLDLLILLLEANAERILSRDLVQALNTRFSDRPWMKARNGKPLTDCCLSRLLRPYGIRPRSLRLGSEIARGYAKDDRMEAFRRYISKTDLASLLTDSESEPNTSRQCNSTRCDQKHQSSDRGCARVEGASPVR